MEIQNDTTSSTETNLIMAVSIPLSVIFILTIIVVSILLVRKKKVEEEPQIDENFYYGMN